MPVITDRLPTLGAAPIEPERGRRVLRRLLARPSLHDRLTTAFRLATSRYPSARELDLLGQMYHEQRARFEKQPALAEALLKTGDSPRDTKLPAVEHAALTVVTQAVMNLDDCVTKK